MGFSLWPELTLENVSYINVQNFNVASVLLLYLTMLSHYDLSYSEHYDMAFSFNKIKEMYSMINKNQEMDIGVQPEFQKEREKEHRD